MSRLVHTAKEKNEFIIIITPAAAHFEVCVHGLIPRPQYCSENVYHAFSTIVFTMLNQCHNLAFLCNMKY